MEATNVREWPPRSVSNGPLCDIRGSVLAVNSRQVAQNQHPHFLSNRERRERSMPDIHCSLTVAAPFRVGAATVRERWILTLLALDLTFDEAANCLFTQRAAL